MPGPRRKPAPIFQPIIRFQPETDADRRAEKLVYSIYADVLKTMDTERNRQVEIGLSEIGGVCRKCLTRKLSGQYADMQEEGPRGWKAMIGTMGHAYLEQHMAELHGNAAAPTWSTDHDEIPKATDDAPLYHMERQLNVLTYKGRTLGGHCDLYVQGETFGVVVDWKFLGKSSLEAIAKGKIKPEYEVQMPSYGLGYELMGYPVTHVLLFTLPRDGDLSEAKPVLMRYERQKSIDALAVITELIDAAELLEATYPGEGWDRLILAQPTSSGCWDCGRFEEYEANAAFSHFRK